MLLAALAIMLAILPRNPLASYGDVDSLVPIET